MFCISEYSLRKYLNIYISVFWQTKFTKKRVKKRLGSSTSAQQIKKNKNKFFQAVRLFKINKFQSTHNQFFPQKLSFFIPFRTPTTSVSRDTPESDNDNDATCAELKQDEGWRSAQNNNNHVNGATMNNTFSNSSFNSMNNNSNHRPNSLCSEPEIRWVDLISVPLMMAYVTRYIYGTDKLRTNAFEVRGLNASSTGVVHLDDLAILSSWLKYITDNIVGLTNLQVGRQLV